MTREELKELREQLQAARKDLLETDEIARDYARRPSTDKCLMDRFSRVQALQSREMALESARRRQLALRRVELALQRLDSPNFGYCLTCEEAIDPQRLRIDPTLGYCRDCASYTAQ